MIKYIQNNFGDESMGHSLREKILEGIKKGELENIPGLINEMIQKNLTEDLYLLADDLYAIGFYPEVKQIVQFLLTEYPDDDNLKVLLAEILFEDGQDLDALSLIQSITNDSEAYLSALLVEADYYESQSLPEVSINKLKEAKAIYPDESVIDFALAEIYMSTGQYGQAIAMYESLIDMGYDDFGEINLLGRLGTAYSAIGEFETGQKYLSEASESEESNEYLFQSVLLHFQAEDYQKVVQKAEKLLKRDPYYTSVYPIIVMSFMHLNQTEKAFIWAENGIQFDHTNPDLYILLAQLLDSLGEKEKALKAYRQSYEIDPEDDGAFIAYLEYLDEHEEAADIIAMIQSSKEELQTIPRVIWIWARAYNALEDYEQAQEKFDEADLYLHDSIPFLKDYLQFLIEDGQRQKARDIATIIAQAEPDNSSIYYLLQEFDDEVR